MLSSEESEKIASGASKRGVTVNSVMQTAWAIVLSRYSGEEDVVFGGTVSGRGGEVSGIEGMIGLFINTLAVRVRVGGDFCMTADPNLK